MFAALKLGLKLTAESGAADPIATALATYGGYDYNPSPATLTSDGSTPVAADGSVQTFADANGSGPTLVQTTASSKPIYRSGGYLDCDATDFMTGVVSPVEAPSGFTVIIQGKSNTTQTIFCGIFANGDGSPYFQISTSTGGVIDIRAVGTTASAEVWPTTNFCLAVRWQDGDQNGYLNGGSDIFAGTEAGVPDFEAIKLATNRAANTYWDGLVGRCLVIFSPLTDAELDSIGAVMGSGWGGWTNVA